MTRHASLLLLAFAACTGCGGSEPERSNVILVITDTVRADKLGCYGETQDLTPRLDKFAAEGVRFARASSHAPWTLPSIATMFTGLHPGEHGAGGRLSAFSPLAKGIETVAGTFSDAGYQVHCIANVGFLTGSFGVTRDFPAPDVDAPPSNLESRSATDVNRLALDWIDKAGDEPFFLVVHYFDPHAVYDPPQPFREKFARTPDKQNRSLQFPTRAQMMAIRSGQGMPPEALIRRAESLHEAELAFLDNELGLFFDQLDARGLDENTAIVITADHGEEFLEHDGFEHGHQLYQELTHVPLLLRAPGIRPAVIDRPVGHVDLAITMCALAGIAPAEQFTYFGQNLLDPDASERPVIAHGNMWADPQTSLRMGDHKLIRHADGTCELYDLAADGAEKNDLAQKETALVAKLVAELDTREELMRAVVKGEVDLSPELRDSLNAMGYGGGDDE